MNFILFCWLCKPVHVYGCIQRPSSDIVDLNFHPENALNLSFRVSLSENALF